MTRSNQAILTAAAVVILSLSVLLVMASMERGAASDATLVRDAAAPEGQASVDVRDADGRDLTRSEEALSDAFPGAQAAGAGAAEVSLPFPTLTGLVVDETGRPVAGAAIVVREDEDSGFEDWSFAEPKPGELVARTTSDTDGTFEVLGHGGRLVSVSASMPGRVDARIGGCSPGSFVRLVLGAGAGLEGFVTCTDAGDPVAGATVRIEHGADGETRLKVTTDARGYFVARDLFPGTGGVLVVPLEHSQPRWREVELEAGKTTRADFTAESGWTLSGRVTDARTGDPIAGAEVSTWSFVGKIVITDGRGFFRTAGIKELPGTLAVRAEGYGRTEVRYVEEREDLDVALERGLRLTGRVLGSDGAPLAGVRVTAAATGFEDRMVRREWRVVRSQADGTFAFNALRSDLELALQLRAPGHGVLLVSVDGDGASAGLIDVGDLRMERQALLAGQVLTHSGEPVPDASLSLSGPDEAVVPVELDRTFKSRWLSVDTRGHFFVPELSAGTWILSASRPDGQRVTESFTLAAGEERRDLELRLPGGMVVGGRVQDPDGHPVADAFVQLVSEGSEVFLRRNTECNAAGEFEFPDVPAGRYTVWVIPPEDVDGEGPPLERQSRNGVEPDGELLEFTLARLDGWIDGRVENAAGEPQRDMYVAVARDSIGFPADGVLTDATGGFRLRVRSGVAVTLLGWQTTAFDDTRNMTVAELRVSRSIQGREQPGMRCDVSAAAAAATPVLVRFTSR